MNVILDPKNLVCVSSGVREGKAILIAILEPPDFDENSIGYEAGKFSGWFFGDVQGEVAETDQDILFFESVTQIDGNLQIIIQEKKPGIYVRENAYQPFEKTEDV